jgi:hypothetical protein
MDSVYADKIGAIGTVASMGIQLYPNPGTGKFVVEWESVAGNDVQIEVFDFIGKQVYHSGVIAGSLLRKEIELNGLASGAYLVRVQIGDRVGVRKYLLE